MISYIQIPIMALSALLLVAMWRFWSVIKKLGFVREVGRRAPSLIEYDLAAASCALMPFFLAGIDWLDFALPYSSAPISSNLAAFLSMAFVGVAAYIPRNPDQRFALHWPGTCENALRTVAALQIINATNLEYALNHLNNLKGVQK